MDPCSVLFYSVCVCVCVCVRERERETADTFHDPVVQDLLLLDRKYHQSNDTAVYFGERERDMTRMLMMVVQGKHVSMTQYHGKI